MFSHNSQTTTCHHHHHHQRISRSRPSNLYFHPTYPL